MKDRLRAAEERITRLESLVAHEVGGEQTSQPPLPRPSTASQSSQRGNSDHPATQPGEITWLVDQLPDHVSEAEAPEGSVIFAGSVRAGSPGGRVIYQWHRPSHALTDSSWDTKIERLQAIANPVRGCILRRLAAAEATIAQLIEEGVVSSTGTAYHHLNALAAAGWVNKKGEGVYALRAARIVPLLVIMAAAENH
ncbi:ArsR/SmtB family transcription factor [Corynebacterium heidelbergense]|uniref:ArsR family transcriptional regulator n=1 Tax=Corynebacterium heidelbergense TaxID=2055947 RepID=A0A364V9Q6_9CORY|nr:winged helix-turn-helix domain-containing protein [Corynebacterium heidelbergense]RAV33392.1 ArsR family transcriptional regulator [Corynebacterium heidelbergense]WCZ37071.1 Helix-turn-helix domain protein [Corynebacterium heidelbergense]